MESLVQQTIRTFSGDGIQARQLANIAHGAARSGKGQNMGAMLSALARSIEPRLGECNAQELANTAWAFAKAGHDDAALFKALEVVVVKRVDEFNSQELANIVWAFATAGYSSKQLFTAFGVAVKRRLDEFTTQGFANVAYAFAKAGHVDTQLFTAMARSADWRINDFNAQDFAHTAWAFAKVGQFDDKLFIALAKSVEWHLKSFNAQGLANTAWAFAKAGRLDAQLFTALARSIELRVNDFNAQDLANTAWAFAKACHLDAQLFTALARSAERSVGDFNAQDLVNTAWAFAKLGHADDKLFSALAKSIQLRLGSFNAQLLANTAWAFAKSDHSNAQLFEALARAAEQLLSDFDAPDLANTAWAFANAGQMDAQLFKALARSAERCIGDFTDEDLDNTAWAFAKAGLQGIAKRLRQKKTNQGDASSSAPLAPADVSKCGCIVVAGGGIGGAAIAVALQKKGFKVVVLEADASFDSRKQGYGLTVQKQDATKALGVSLVQDDAPSTSHYTFSSDGQILGFFGEAFSDNKDRLAPSADAGRFIHIPRQMLRSRIIEQIRPGTIKWSSKLKNFSCWTDDDTRDGNGVTVTLTDGTSIDASLVVGADGIFSTVRRQLALPGDRLNYLNLIVVLGIIPTDCGEDGSDDSKGALPLVQRRIFETVDGSARIYAMPFTPTVTMWQLSFPYPEEEAKALCKDPAALKAEILRLCGKWHEPVPSLLRRTPLDSMSGYPVYDRDLLEPHILRPPQKLPRSAGAEPKPQRRVTLIGDAAHPMSPFRAQGANQALADGVLLADILEDNVRKHGPQLGFDAALPIFEQKMLNRSARMVTGSREKAKEMHSSLAMQPARKVQRDTGIDMPSIIKTLRVKGIGAHSATDPRGLDAVVADAIHKSSTDVSATTLNAVQEQSNSNTSKRKNGCDTFADSAPLANVSNGSEACVKLWGYFDDEWHKCVLLKAKKSGKQKVQWADGTMSVLDDDCIQPRAKKSRTVS
eukprot:TRINITY_DN26430_c0_g1_i1.p1 TRINITY_DN26430_c0_g1~~TRINITY_DN26430_c0_g1_i1.p1  ORF type:complete len:1082 (+),score=131.33 TRINITY_DN26430_c0_g1_i1:283-3246(+)